MATFVDLGNMRAKLDTRTGQIRITSGEKGSLLKEKGFVLNVYRGSKEYILLNNLVKESNGEASTSQGEFVTGKELQSILAKLDRAETENTKAHLLADLVEWGDNIRDRRMLVRTIESLLFVEDYIGGLYRSGRYVAEEENWLTSFVEATRNTGAAMNRVDHVRASLDDAEWIKKLSDFVDETHEHNMEHLKDDDHVHNSFIYLAHRVASYANGGWKKEASKDYSLPKIVHMSEKYHSSVPDEIPLGVRSDGTVVRWETKKFSHMAVSGKPGIGKTMMLSSLLYHINRHKTTTKSYVSSMYPFKNENHDLYLDKLSLLDENIDINNDPMEYIRKAYSIMMNRLEYMESKKINSLNEEMSTGETKRVFLVIDGFNEWEKHYFSVDEKGHRSPDFNEERYSKLDFEEARKKLLDLSRFGRSTGVHVVLSSQSHVTKLGLGNQMESNILVRAEIDRTLGEVDLTVSNKKETIRAFSVE